MAMDPIFAALVCYLLALSSAEAQTGKQKLPVTPTTTNMPLLTNLTHTTATPSNSTAHATVISNETETTAPFISTTQENEAIIKTTAAATTATSHLRTSQSSTAATPPANSMSLTTTSPGTRTPTVTTPAKETAEGHTSTPDTAVITTAASSHTVNTTAQNRTPKAFQLDISEKNMTIVFSVVLGVLAFALVGFMFHKCKQKIQYLHQPLHNADDTDAFVADDDTLVISGGLYDGHPIYDNIPTAPADRSQFRLEFLR